MLNHEKNKTHRERKINIFDVRQTLRKNLEYFQENQKNEAASSSEKIKNVGVASGYTLSLLQLLSSIKQNEMLISHVYLPLIANTPSENVHITLTRKLFDGLKFQKIPGDGHCLFHAIGLCLGKDTPYLRRIVASYMENKIHEFYNYREGTEEEFKAYIESIRNGNEWGDHIEIEAIQRITNMPIIIIRPDANPVIPDNIDNYAGKPIFIYYNGHNHYDAFILQEGFNARAILNNIRNAIRQGQRIAYSNVAKPSEYSTTFKQVLEQLTCLKMLIECNNSRKNIAILTDYNTLGLNNNHCCLLLLSKEDLWVLGTIGQIPAEVHSIASLCLTQKIFNQIFLIDAPQIETALREDLISTSNSIIAIELLLHLQAQVDLIDYLNSMQKKAIQIGSTKCFRLNLEAMFPEVLVNLPVQKRNMFCMEIAGFIEKHLSLVDSTKAEFERLRRQFFTPIQTLIALIFLEANIDKILYQLTQQERLDTITQVNTQDSLSESKYNFISEKTKVLEQMLTLKRSDISPLGQTDYIMLWIHFDKLGRLFLKEKQYHQAALLFNAADFLNKATNSDIPNHPSQIWYIQHVQKSGLCQVEKKMLEEQFKIPYLYQENDNHYGLNLAYREKLKHLRMTVKLVLNWLNNNKKPTEIGIVQFYQFIQKYSQQEKSENAIQLFKIKSKLTAVNIGLVSYWLFKFISFKMNELLCEIFNECIQLIQAYPPCKYELVSIGSLAREEMTPYSDIEYLLLIENENELDYFQKLANLFELKIINLGETELIKGQNILPPGYPTPVEKGVSLDVHKRANSRHLLIRTPKSLAEFQLPEKYVYEETDHLSSALLTTRIIMGNDDGELMQQYYNALDEILDKPYGNTKQSLRKIYVKNMLQESNETYKPSLASHDSGALMNVKKDFYRLPNMIIDALALNFKIGNTNTFDRLEILAKVDVLNIRGVKNIQQALSNAMLLRLKVYMKYQCQEEMVDPIAIKLALSEKKDKSERYNLLNIYGLSEEDINQINNTYKTLISFNRTIAKAIAEDDNLVILKQSEFHDNDLKSRALIAERIYDLKEAEANYKELLAKNLTESEKIEVVTRLVNVYFQSGNSKKAYDTFRSLNLSNVSDYAVILHSISLLRMGQPKDSAQHIITYLMKMKGIPERYNELVNNLGSSFYQIGFMNIGLNCTAYAASLVSPEIYIPKNKKSTTARYNLMTMLSNHVGVNKSNRLEAAYKLVQLKQYSLGYYHPNTMGAISILANAKIEVGEIEDATHMLLTAVKHQQNLLHGEHYDLIEMYNNLSYCYIKLAKFKKAFYYVEKALNIAQTNSNLPALTSVFISYFWNFVITNPDRCFTHKLIAMHAKIFNYIKESHPDSLQLCELEVINGYLLAKEKKYDEAIYILDKTYSIYTERRFDKPYYTEKVRVFNVLAQAYQERNQGNDIDKAIEFFQKAIDLEDVLGDKKDINLISASFHNLAAAYMMKEQFDDAWEQLDKAFALLKNEYKEVNAALKDVLIARAQCASKLFMKHYFPLEHFGKQDVQKIEESLNKIKKVYGDNHYFTAICLLALGQKYVKTKKLAKGIEYLNQAYKIDQSIADELAIARDLNGLSSAYYLMGNTNSAINYAQRSLQINEEIYGKKDFEVAINLNNLGNYYQTMGELDNAMTMFYRSHTILKKQCGLEHEYTIDSGNSLYRILFQKLDITVICQQSLEKHLRISARDGNELHLKLLTEPLLKTLEIDIDARDSENKNYTALHFCIINKHLNCLILLLLRGADPFIEDISGKTPFSYLEQKEFNKLWIKLDKSTSKLKSKYGWLNKKLAHVSNLKEIVANAYINNNYNFIAKESNLAFLQELLLIIKQSYGEYHYLTAYCLRRIGMEYYKFKEYVEAMSYFERAYEQDLYLNNLSALGNDLNYLGISAKHLNDYKLAIRYYTQSLELHRKIYGNLHFLVAVNLNNMGHVYGEMEDFENALSYFYKAFKIYTKTVGLLHEQAQYTFMIIMDILFRKYEIDTPDKLVIEKALRNAAKGGDIIAIKMFLNCDIDVNIDAPGFDTDSKRTALHLAVINKNSKCAKALLRANSNHKIKDSHNKTVLDYAMDSEQKEVIALIKLADMIGSSAFASWPLYDDDGFFPDSLTSNDDTTSNLEVQNPQTFVSNNGYGSEEEAEELVKDMSLLVMDNRLLPTSPTISHQISRSTCKTTALATTVDRSCKEESLSSNIMQLDDGSEVQKQQTPIQQVSDIGQEKFKVTHQQELAYIECQLGNYAFANGQVQKAIGHYEKSITEDLKSPAYHNLACCYHIERRIDDADQCFQIGLAINPKSNLMIEYAHFLCCQKRFEDAVLYLQQALEVEVNKESLSYGPLEVNTVMPFIKAEIQTQGEIEISLKLLVQCLSVVSYHHLSQSEDLCNTLLTLEEQVSSDDDYLSYRLLGHCYQLLGDSKTAKTYWEIASAKKELTVEIDDDSENNGEAETDEELAKAISLSLLLSRKLPTDPDRCYSEDSSLSKEKSPITSNLSIVRLRRYKSWPSFFNKKASPSNSIPINCPRAKNCQLSNSQACS